MLQETKIGLLGQKNLIRNVVGVRFSYLILYQQLHTCRMGDKLVFILPAELSRYCFVAGNTQLY